MDRKKAPLKTKHQESHCINWCCSLCLCWIAKDTMVELVSHSFLVLMPAGGFSQKKNGQDYVFGTALGVCLNVAKAFGKWMPSTSGWLISVLTCVFSAQKPARWWRCCLQTLYPKPKETRHRVNERRALSVGAHPNHVTSDEVTWSR